MKSKRPPTLVDTYVRCGTPPARPAQLSQVPGRDGEGDVALRVPQAHVPEVRRAVDAWATLWATSVALSEGNRERLRARLRRKPADG